MYTKYFYATRIKPEVLRRWALKLAQQDNTNWLELDEEDVIPMDEETYDIPIGFKMEVVREMLKAEDDATKAAVERVRKLDAGAVEDEVDNERRQARLQKMDS